MKSNMSTDDTNVTDGKEFSDSGQNSSHEVQVARNVELTVRSSSNVNSILRGDAVGDTLYSERWILNILMDLVKKIKWNEELEKRLCLLWDMSVDEEVCDYLASKGFFEIMRCTYMGKDADRLMEIGVGLMANMISFKVPMIHFCSDIKNILFVKKVLEKAELPCLIQAMRLIQTGCSQFENFIKSNDDVDLREIIGCAEKLKLNMDSNESQLQTLFAEHMENFSTIVKWSFFLYNTDFWLQSFCFILKSSLNRDLLLKTWETLYSIVTVTVQDETLCKNVLCIDVWEALLESVLELYVRNVPEQSNDLIKATECWSNIVLSFSSYEEGRFFFDANNHEIVRILVSIANVYNPHIMDTSNSLRKLLRNIVLTAQGIVETDLEPEEVQSICASLTKYHQYINNETSDTADWESSAETPSSDTLEVTELKSDLSDFFISANKFL